MLHLPTDTHIHQVCSSNDDKALCLAVTELDTRYKCEDVQKTSPNYPKSCACAGTCEDDWGNVRVNDENACDAVNMDTSLLTDGNACRAVVKEGSLPTCTEAASVADSSDEDKHNCALVNTGRLGCVYIFTSKTILYYLHYPYYASRTSSNY